MFRRQVLLLVLASLAWARQDPAICGTHLQRSREELFLHRQHAARRGKLGFRATAASTAQDLGQIAILEDSNGVVGRRNPFNLDQKTIVFSPSVPSASAYHFEVDGPSFDEAAAGTPLDGLGDDDSRSIALPFSFPFFGANYSQVFVNSDGNLTFQVSDHASADRSLGRVTAGPPRIAALFADLNPAASARPVEVLTTAERVVITWPLVPLFSDTSIGLLQRFQIRLYPSGRIEFAYAGTTATDAVVGIAPGKGNGTTMPISFIAGGTQEFSGSIVERFSGSDAIDIITAAQQFYQTHQDSYDYLVFYNALNIPAASGAVAYEVTARNKRSGYGDVVVEDGAEYGSASRLQSVLNMGPLSQYPVDPNAVVGARAISRDTPLTVLGHEAGHLFLAFATLPPPHNPQALLGRSNVHWSFDFNSEASYLEGNRIRDNGAGVSPRFTTIATVEGYAPLDQYLMGFRAPEDVPGSFYVTQATSSGGGSRAPQSGVSFDGQRVDIGVPDIVQSLGPRIPDSTVAQRHFRFGFVLIVAAGTAPTAAQLAQVDQYRSRFESSYANATGNRATADTGLRQAVHLSAYPAAGVIAGGTGTMKITLDLPADTALTLMPRTPNGIIGAPASVTIAAGDSSASFTVDGLRAGVEELSIEPADPTYETAYARVQVIASTAALHIDYRIVNTDSGVTGRLFTVILKAVDSNKLPYSNIRIIDDKIPPTVFLTDASGEVGISNFSISNIPAELKLMIDGVPSSAITIQLPTVFKIVAGGVVNAASYTPGLTPNSIATIFGSGLATADFASTKVLLNGVAANVIFVSAGQINFIVPVDLPLRITTLQVSNASGTSDAAAVTVRPASPGIFFDPATALGAILLAGTSQRGPFLPGQAIEIYGTGLGAETSAQITIGGVSAQVVYAGPAPGFLGLNQINAVIPSSTPAGAQFVYVTAGGISSNTVKIAIASGQ